MSMSDTPRTDAEVKAYNSARVDFARELERENAGFRKALRKIIEGGYAPGADRAHPSVAVAREALAAGWW